MKHARLAGFCTGLLAVAIRAVPAGAGQLDAYGPPAEIAAYCKVLATDVGSYRRNEPRAFRHIVIAGGYAVATIQTGFDSFNVMSKRTATGWSDPFVVGPDYPHVASLTALGVPAKTAQHLLAALFRTDDIPASDRIGACP